MHLGDINSKFFYSVVKAKTARNHISQLSHEVASRLSDFEAIKSMAPSFYENFVHNFKLLECISKCIVKKKLTFQASSWL